MNGYMNKYEKDAVSLRSDTEVMEKEFIARLKAIEVSATEMEGHILDIDEAKKNIAEEVVEAEQQVL